MGGTPVVATEDGGPRSRDGTGKLTVRAAHVQLRQHDQRAPQQPPVLELALALPVHRQQQPRLHAGPDRRVHQDGLPEEQAAQVVDQQAVAVLAIGLILRRRARGIG